MRYRNQSQRREVKSTFKSFSGPTAPAFVLGVVPRMVGSTDEMTDYPTKGYRRKSKSGGIINTPMTRRTSLYTLSPKTWSQWSRTTPPYIDYKVEDDMVTVGEFDLNTSHPHFGIVAATVAELKTQAVTEAFARVGRADVEALVTLAELPETIAFLAAPVAKGVNLVKRGKSWLDYRKRIESINAKRLSKYQALPRRIQDRRGPPKLVEIRPFRVGKFQATDVSSFWLGIRYGLMPLISEIEGYWKAFTEKSEKPERLTARATVQRDLTIVKDTTKSTSTYVDRTHSIDCSFNITVRAGVLYNPRTETFSSKYGLELHRLPAALYEAVPLSFVTDWFHSAADYYDAITATVRARTILAAWTKVTVEYTIVQTNLQTLKNGHRIDGKWNGEIAGMETGTITVREPASISDVAPQVRVKLNAKRVVDGLALIHQFTSSRAGKRS